MPEDIHTLAELCGFSHIAPLSMAALHAYPEIREMCAQNRCGRYGHSWSCPPGCGTWEETSEALKNYSHGLLVQTTGELSDDFDYENIQSAMSVHKKCFEELVRCLRALSLDMLPLSAGSCTVCRSCTYPDKPCRFPKKRLSSMEAYGLFVSEICIASGLQYNYGERTITYTSCILYNEETANVHTERDIS